MREASLLRRSGFGYEGGSSAGRNPRAKGAVRSRRYAPGLPAACSRAARGKFVPGMRHAPPRELAPGKLEANVRGLVNEWTVGLSRFVFGRLRPAADFAHFEYCHPKHSGFRILQRARWNKAANKHVFELLLPTSVTVESL